MSDPAALARAAAAIEAADAVLFTTGAGMGVDSGLPDFRGDRGFWRAYPAYEKLGLSFSAMANPRWFERDPMLAWGFYGHRLELYRRTVPHAGYAIVRAWADAAALGAFAFTSNVDGQLQRAGFDDDRVVECHGAIASLQCTRDCGIGIYGAEGVEIGVDPDTFRAHEPLPRCPACGALARPNVLMFGDDGWLGGRTDAQYERLEAWLAAVPERPGALVVIECGAGKAVPTVRSFGERSARAHEAVLIRINPREAEGPRGTVSIDDGALAALSAIAGLLTSRSRTS